MTDVGGGRRIATGIAYPLFLIALTCVLYQRAFTAFFSQDDLLFLMLSDGIEPWPESFPPLRRLLSVRLFFAAAWRFFGDNHALYHVVILTVHGLNAWLTSLLARRLGLTEQGARIAGLLFVLSPVAFTCLHWISGFQDVLLAFFALLCALCLTRRGAVWELLAVLAYVALMLSKEAGFLLLPTLIWLLPGEAGEKPKSLKIRRLRLSLIGLALGAVLLFLVGAFQERAAGDPYATAYGANIVFNLLTYCAWLARPWVFFPDFRPEFDTGLVTWGLVLPSLYLILLWRKAAWRAGLLRAGVLFVALLLPVLPLVRHSYFYYLYAPLLPFWILLAAGLDRLPARLVRFAFILPVLLMILTAWQGWSRHDQMLPGGRLQADPMLRYGMLVRTAVEDMRAMDAPIRGKLLLITPFQGEAVDLARGLRDSPGASRTRFLPLAKALYGGKALRLFFPQVSDVRFRRDLSGEAERDDDYWRGSRMLWVAGRGHVNWLGRGETGRMELARLFFRFKDYGRARREIEGLMEDRPDDPDLLYNLAVVAQRQGDAATVEELFGRLMQRARSGEASEAELRALQDLERSLGLSGGAGEP